MHFARWVLVWAHVALVTAALCGPEAARTGLLRSARGSPRRPGATQLRATAAMSLVARGGAVAAAATAEGLYNRLFGGLVATAALSKLAVARADLKSAKDEAVDGEAAAAARKLKLRFLPVFWVLRMSDWLQGPYFYEVYASKMFGGAAASLEMVSRLFLTGFGTTALLGPSLGQLADSRGRKLGTVLFCAFYALSALSTRSPLLWVLFAGRVMGGLGTALLMAAPEAWVVGEATKTGAAGSLGSLFGAAYAGDALVAITAGQLASLAATARGSTGPFELSCAFVGLGAVLAATCWPENKAATSDAGQAPTIGEALSIIRRDRRIALVGAAQALFEGAMYVFVMQWPPALTAAVRHAFGAGAAVPFGKVFSCFMVACLVGSTAFSAASKKIATEQTATATFGLATLAMALATRATAAGATSIAQLTAAFILFEACVGLYFPSIGTLRAKYVPDSHRTVILGLFGIPLNVIVVSVFLSIKRLGVTGALAISSSALALATAAMTSLLFLRPAPQTMTSDGAKPQPA